MGTVYAAYDPELHRRVALKLLHPRPVDPAQSESKRPSAGSGPDDGQARLMREAQAMARLAHPNVVSVHDAGTFGEQVFVAMELVEGKTLREWVGERARTWREVVEVFLAAGRGLAAAHAVGLVHRDFKPANVLVGNDGRARVTDFGLARASGAPESTAAPSAGDGAGSDSFTSPLTAVGTVMGTPPYMAPEQLRGLAVDARTDQFSFCVSLWEALYGERPFHGKTRAELTAAVCAGKLPEPPRGPRVPAAIRRVAERGLAAEPAQRFPSMELLLAELAQDPGRTRRRLLAVTAMIALVAGALLGARQLASRQDRLCRGADARLRGVWDEPARHSVEKAFLATGKPFAAAAARGVTGELEAYTASWVAMREEACVAARVRRDESEEVLALRTGCLDRRLKELGALVGVFAQADATVVEKAVSATGGLSRIADCADVPALRAPVPPPRDEATRSRVEALQTELARARALRQAGRAKPALALVPAEVEAARAIPYPPLLAEACMLQGDVLEAVGDFGGAERAFQEAAQAAEAGHDDKALARAWVNLAVDVGQFEAKPEAAQVWLDYTRAALARIGGDDLIEADRLLAQGNMLWNKGKFAESLPFQEQSLALRIKVHGPDHPRLGRFYGNVANTYAAMGEREKALEIFRRLLPSQEKALGVDHPDVALTLNNIATASNGGPGAFAALERAAAIWEKSLGPDSPDTALAYANIAELHRREKRFAESLAIEQRILASREKTLGPDHPEVIWSLIGLGESLLGLERPVEAAAHLERALVLCGKSEVEPFTRAQSSFDLAQALWAAGRDRARALQLAAGAAKAYAEDPTKSAEAEQVKVWIAARRPSPRR